MLHIRKPQLNQRKNLRCKKYNKEISDRIDYLVRSPAYMTLKDRKMNFLSKLTCPLINPAKSKIGNVSKKIIEKINSLFLETLVQSQNG